MSAANKKHKAIFFLLALGIALCLAGHRHQQRRAASQITWQDVNATLQSVEVAKLKLFQSLNEKAR